jgi:N-acetylmuramic acid 6-phosphate (MurNAc-6-P) etherase
MFPSHFGAYLESTLTEERNLLTADIDTLPTLDMLVLINAEDQQLALAVRNELPNIADAVNAITARCKAAVDLHRRGHIRKVGPIGCI